MDAGWVKIKTLFSTRTFSQDRSKIEEVRRTWASRLTKFNVDFQFVIENDGITYELNLYVRNIDELKTIDFVENYEKEQTKEEINEETEDAKETIEENITSKNDNERYSLKDVKAFIIIFSLISISFSILAVIYGFQIINKMQNNILENISVDVTYMVVFIVIGIFSIIADIRFCKKAKELEKNGDK